MSRPTIDPPAIVQPAEKDQAWDIHVKAAIGMGKRSAQSCATAGAELLKAKMSCPPGLWLKTLQKHGLSRRTASYWIESFRRFPDMGNVAHVNQVVAALGDLSSAEEQETPGREVGDEPEEHPALKIILCNDCRRKGPARDCKKCAKARGEFVGPKGSGKRSNGGKGGGSAKSGRNLFDWKDYDLVASRFYRLPEKIAKVYPAEAESDRHRRAKELLSELAELLKSWRASIQGAK